MNDRAHSIYVYACTYAKAAKLLNQSELFLPSMVNAALALELYFKSFYYLEYGKDFKINDRHSHDFFCLFEELRDTVKRDIESDFDQIMKNRDMRDVEQIEMVSKVVIPRGIMENVEVWSTVFVKVRYMYDNMEKPRSMMFFPEIEEVIRNAIYKRKPEWRP